MIDAGVTARADLLYGIRKTVAEVVRRHLAVRPDDKPAVLVLSADDKVGRMLIGTIDKLRGEDWLRRCERDRLVTNRECPVVTAIPEGDFWTVLDWALCCRRHARAFKKRHLAETPEDTVAMVVAHGGVSAWSLWPEFVNGEES